jgi:hypothetical protein
MFQIVSMAFSGLWLALRRRLMLDTAFDHRHTLFPDRA